ncbi:TetR/AcrR family transcriptional regulator [Kitasatospora sp. SUK 42]|uniref:TetR/AcrR family transcriptional regulator n=1 Tax=Kitasatospora sp. SUK 42 TaxID=1588882 RepID=UPI0018C93740|nr:TetR/AcrR family transcriptional regulator [Kitasatospora sp. SUK 42]MBV2153337.1 TetR/AcrR family transcriptional regulator [Kitasatospora sp. SUK 42]
MSETESTRATEDAQTAEDAPPTRPHTGRRRNEAAHRAILDAALRLLAESDGTPVTIDAIARTAGVGKQTVYRWWPSKGAVLLDALTDRADQDVSGPDTGALHTDLRAFLGTSFEAAQRDTTASALRTLAREAARDPHLAELMRTFTSARREALRELLARGRDRGELAEDADLDLIVDQVYGVLWYRFLLGHAPLDAAVAERLADTLVAGNQAR